MEKITFSIDIKASRTKVWEILWDKNNYEKWTNVFMEGSTVVTDWKEGSKVLFLDGKGSGMVSKIASNRPVEFMSFEHLGQVKENVEDTSSEGVKAWQGAKENYTLLEDGDDTRLDVEMDITAEHKSYFENTWPKAMSRIKEMAEEK